MKKAPLHILLPLVFLLCYGKCKETVIENDLSNKERYDIHIGETFEIYTISNGSARFEQHLDLHEGCVHLTGQRVAKDSPGCNGCNTIYANVFTGTKSGTDTIRIFNHSYVDNESATLKQTIVVTVAQ